MAGPELVSAAVEFEAAIQAWARPPLEEYVERLERFGVDAASRSTSKEFNDPIWDTITLRPFELLVLDSPIVQRLRSIRQLGVVHLVYPAAVHTRFEHSLGTLHQVARMVASINAHAETTPGIDPALENLLRLTALCHDIGHGAMSHVSENALKHFDVESRIRLEFSDTADVEDASLSEIAAYYIVRSSAFGAVIDFAQKAFPDHSLPTSPITLMSDAIIGKTMADEVPLAHELISGPFDADKLDYMTRDARMTGVPVVTDIPRLVQKVRAVACMPSELPREVAATVAGGSITYTMTGVHLSGGRTLDELMLGQTLLFDKLYRHHKVRAAEAMVASIFREIAELLRGGPIMAAYLLDDNDLLRITPSGLERHLGRELTEDERPRALLAEDMAHRVKERQLFVRAFAFAQNMPRDPFRADEEHWLGLEELIRATRAVEDRGRIVEAIAQETQRIIELLGRGDLIDHLPTESLKPYIWLDPTQAPPQSNDTARAYLIAGRTFHRFRDDYAETTGWSNAYLLTRDLGYVFAPAELAPYVHLATTRIVREQFGVRMPESMLAYAKQDPSQLEDLRRELAKTDYFHDVPHDLRPLPERLGRADVPPVVEDLMRNVAGYEGPVREGQREKRSSLHSDARIIEWLRQFEEGSLIEAALAVLGRLRLIGRADAVDALTKFFDSRADFAKASICPLGTAKDSSVILTYYAGDLKGQHATAVRTLEEALEHPDDPIVFVDDLIGSGSQSISIVESWLGAKPTVDLKELREPLTEELQEHLRRAKLGFVFVGGTATGREALERRLKERELDATVSVHLTDLPQAFGTGILDGAEAEEAFRARCFEIGVDLLVDESLGHDRDWAEGRALGYGNDAFLVVFPYNTPAQTLTCLWKTGVLNGVPWTPLFPRRIKQ